MRWFLLLSVLVSLGAEIRTPNFHVTAADEKTADLLGKWAEHHRRKKGVEWLGKEMTNWANPCTVNATVTIEPPQGTTTFDFLNGRVMSMQMTMSGSLDRMVYALLPHEIMHTVLAHHFRCAVPRWADEGAAVFSEDAETRDRHAQMAGTLLQQNKLFRMSALLSMQEYPSSQEGLIILYCQGFALTDYLVNHRDHATFLKFVGEGMRTKNWDKAVQAVYGFKGVNDLEETWLKHMKNKSSKAIGASFAPWKSRAGLGNWPPTIAAL